MHLITEVIGYYFGFNKNFNDGNPTVILTTTEIKPVSFYIEIPGISFYYNGTITANKDDTVVLPTSVEVLSHNDQDKGIFLETSSAKVTVIGQNLNNPSYSGETFLTTPIKTLYVEKYTYYGISVTDRSHRNGSILIVGTENNTMMNLTVTQPVTIKVNDTDPWVQGCS